MKNKMQIFKGLEIEVSFIDDENFRYDISGVAQKYGKRFSNFVNLQQTKEYIKSVRKVTLLSEAELIFKVGNHIKVHHSIMIEFMRWVNPAFSVLANKMVYDIFIQGCKVNQKEIETLQKTNIQLKKDRNVYGKRRGYGMETVTHIINNTDAEISKEAFNVLLCEEGLISKDVCDCCNRHDYIAVHRYSEYQGNTLLVNYDSAVSVLEKYEIKKVVDNQLVFEF